MRRDSLPGTGRKVRLVSGIRTADGPSRRYRVPGDGGDGRTGPPCPRSCDAPRVSPGSTFSCPQEEVGAGEGPRDRQSSESGVGVPLFGSLVRSSSGRQEMVQAHGSCPFSHRCVIYFTPQRRDPERRGRDWSRTGRVGPLDVNPNVGGPRDGPRGVSASDRRRPYRISWRMTGRTIKFLRNPGRRGVGVSIIIIIRVGRR